MRYVVFNRKGGVGKSTIVCNLAAVNAMAGRRTLVVDLDPQGNATQYLTGHDPGELEPGLLEYFESTLGFKLLRSATDSEVIHPSHIEGLDLLPSSPDLQELQTKLETRHKIYKLRDLLDDLSRYDDVFIDTPPAVSFFTISALIASESCLIPFDCDEFSRRALFQLLETVSEVREDHNPRLRIGGVVVNQFQSRARLPHELVAELRDEGLPVLEPYLGSSVKVRESHRVHRPLVEYLPRHKLSAQFRELHAALPGTSG
ncbi:MAG: ParA family protein [Acidobacteriota bacterium]